MPNDVEIKTMETFLDVLKPIVEITEAIGGERLVMISTVRPLLHKLISMHLVEKSSDSQLSKTLKHVLLTDLKARYTTTELEDFLNIACFLDPRFKNMSFLSDTNKDNIKALVEGEAEKILLGLSERKVSDSESSTPKPPTKKPKKGLMSLLEDVVNSPNEDVVLLTPERRKVEVKKEICNYLCLDVAVGNPLNWWHQNEKLFPALSHMARKYLCMPATSMPTEGCSVLLDT